MSHNFSRRGTNGRNQSASIEYNEAANSYVVTPPSNARVSTTVIKAISEIIDTDPLQMEPAFDGHNFDVLDKVSSWHDTEGVDIDGSVTVTVADHRVTIRSDGCIDISPPA